MSAAPTGYKAARAGVLLWQSLSDAADTIKELTDGMPAPSEGFERLPESDAELREGIALLEKAIQLLVQAHERETPRYDNWCSEHEWVEQTGETRQ